MIPHELKIGQIVYDAYYSYWGKITKINGKAEDAAVVTGEEQVTYEVDDTEEIRENRSWWMYPLVEGRTFQGEEVCDEINRDEYGCKMDYPYYLPFRDENCFEFELDK